MALKKHPYLPQDMAAQYFTLQPHLHGFLKEVMQANRTPIYL